MPIKKTAKKKTNKKTVKKPAIKKTAKKTYEKLGRPTKYTPKLLERARAYLTDFYHHDAKFPSNVGLSLYLDVSRETIQTWRNDEDKADFSYILNKIESVQHQMLIGNGLSGDYNSNIAKLVLGKHGYHDKQQIEDTTRPIELTDDELDRKIQQLESMKEQGLRD